MKTKVTKKAVIELATIIRNKGYWSKDVQEYLEQFSFWCGTRQKLNDKAKYYEREIMGN